jgi:L,D-peptidoglycan transpeptidase YkuD (ErfK/YbiS/YcfS/YnhG family)
MSTARVLSSAAVIVAIGAAAAVVIGMASAQTSASKPAADQSAGQSSAAPNTTAPIMMSAAAGATPMATPSTVTSAAPSTSVRPTTSTPSPAIRTASAPRTTSPATVAASRPRAAVTTSAAKPAATKPVVKSTPKPAPKPVVLAPAGQALPLGYSTGNATRVITVTAYSGSSTRSYATTATVQAWNKYGSGWQKWGPAILAHIGSQGMTASPSEFVEATPMGSFTLTQAFGRMARPSTSLPYFQTSYADWWISQTTGSGSSLYNTHQHCSSGCPFTTGDPNENLYGAGSVYNYAVVIDYHPPAIGDGSAFFFHVTNGAATAGCVAIPQSNLLTIMSWLAPSTHPRMLIGVA